MGKYLDDSIYQTEYSIAFQCKTKKNNDKIQPFVNIVSPGRRHRSIQDNMVHNYRHKLKQIILQRLDDMEIEFDRDRNSQIKNSPSKISVSKLCVKKTSPIKEKYCNKKKEDSYSELVRSRSMALKFKLKNESTQLWWVNDEEKNESSDTENKRYTKSKSPTRRESVVKPDYKTLYHHHSYIVPNISITNFSHSMNTGSSISTQMAQATGSQSTTDDISSFNHDNDQESNELCISNLKDKLPSKNIDVPRLNLALTETEKASKNTFSPILFQEPYQKDDFIKDSTSSESNEDLVPNSFTYRIE